MIGRGLVANPALLDILWNEKDVVDKALLRKFP